MRVARIEIFGFKSFVDRLQLPMESGITGVVGPNGCGKSNIVDAVRWVLGETRAKNLRGGVLEDVIFNGTDKLRPLGLAEVTLTLRASGTDFFADLVSPDLEAQLVAESVTTDTEPEGEEAVEESLPEEQSAEGRPHLTVIPGRLDEKEEVEESAAREVASEAVSEEEPETQTSDDQKPQEGQRSAATLLSRFSWLKAANEVQVTRRLYRSGESEFFLNRVPCRLKDLKEFFRAIGISARAYTIVAQGEVARIVTSKPDQRRIILEEAAGVLGFRDKIAAAKRRLDDTTLNISRLDDVAKEVTRQVNSLKRQASRARNRKALKDRVQELELVLFRNKYLGLLEASQTSERTLSERRQVEQEVEAELQKLQAVELDSRNELMSVDVAGDELRSRIDGIKEELRNRAQQRTERASRINELNALIASRETEIKRLEERKLVLSSRKEESKQEVVRLEQSEVELSDQIAQVSSGDEEELRAAAEKLSALREDLREGEDGLRKTREKLVHAQGQLQTIEKQLVASSPLAQLKRTLGERAPEFLSSEGEQLSFFIDGLQVPPELTRAVQAVLAEKAGFIVASGSREVARNFVQNLLEGTDDDDGLALGVFEAGEGVEPSDEVMVRPAHLPFRSILSEISVSEKLRHIAPRVFQGIYLAPSLDQAIRYFDEHGEQLLAQGAQITLVTPEGDLLTSFSFYSNRHSGGILQLRNQASRLRESCVELEQIEVEQKDGLRVIQEKIFSAEQHQRQVLQESQRKQARVQELSKDLGSVRGRLQAEKKVSEQVAQDALKIEQNVGDARVQISEFVTERKGVEEEVAALVSDVESDMQAELARLTAEYQKLDQNRQAGRDQLAAVSQKVEETRRDLDKVRTEESDISLELQRVRLETEHLEERVTEEYGSQVWLECSRERNAEEEQVSEEDQKEMQGEVGKLKSRMAREGEVDPTTIQQYEEEQARLDSLLEQKKDLEQASETLKKTIERLRQTSERRFLETFEKVSENFSKLVPRLFGGGRGSLELLDPKNPLESGVDIIARPPGKKLKSIDLLSGGEKALCATALIFGMFMERPSPLCVLDEVDAPLDDANLVRFLSLIKEMSTKTQFLLITHNKGSMAVADKLVGVTMQEPGASKVITVSLQEAYSQVA